MLTKEKILTTLRQQQAYLAVQYGVKRIGLFGSYAKDKSTETSDVDLVIEFERPIGFKFIELTEYLEILLGKKVDVLTPTGIQGIRITHIAQDIKEHLIYV